ncbi:MAG: hypothetical protein KKD73_08890 [Proteobacteria bacterium]|nr:hypothetical protein [Pseudomonadota bacterium]MBU1640557.1 hypothetical protein [Pseudomonadota bacterium]
MLVPMELYNLTLKKGHLSPELTIGWRVGKYVEEFFAGLEDVSIAAARDDDAILALKYLRRQHSLDNQVTIADKATPWDFLFFHATTGTLLGFCLIRHRTQLPYTIRSLETDLVRDNQALTAIYQAALEQLVNALLDQPVTSYCQVRQVRCRRLQTGVASGQEIHCRSCGQPILHQRAWDIEGRICCPTCSGLVPAWQ